MYLKNTARWQSITCCAKRHLASCQIWKFHVTTIGSSKGSDRKCSKNKGVKNVKKREMETEGECLGPFFLILS